MARKKKTDEETRTNEAQAEEPRKEEASGVIEGVYIYRGNENRKVLEWKEKRGKTEVPRRLVLHRHGVYRNLPDAEPVRKLIEAGELERIKV